eukprot:jgi/Chlat1/5958/Chrsp4S06287
MAAAMAQVASFKASRSSFAGSALSVRPVAPVAAQRSSSGCVVVAKVASPAQELRALTNEELDAQVETARKDLFQLRMKQGTRQQIKTSDFKPLRKKIAVCLTIKREREIEAGITKRESRKADKRAKLAQYPGLKL